MMSCGSAFPATTNVRSRSWRDGEIIRGRGNRINNSLPVNDAGVGAASRKTLTNTLAFRTGLTQRFLRGVGRPAPSNVLPSNVLGAKVSALFAPAPGKLVTYSSPGLGQGSLRGSISSSSTEMAFHTDRFPNSEKAVSLFAGTSTSGSPTTSTTRTSSSSAGPAASGLRLRDSNHLRTRTRKGWRRTHRRSRRRTQFPWREINEVEPNRDR